MLIEIRIKNKVVDILLLDKEVVLAKSTIVEEHQLSEKLLLVIDELLMENGLTSKDIAKMTLQSDMGDNFTTHRIALTVTEAFNWGKTVDN
ncbi:MAG: hypothetical protein WC823_02980 [Parcubacteria group bacterium]|jgi:tRNA A37 threonylcarbamoyladenosine modification protein TsaB